MCSHRIMAANWIEIIFVASVAVVLLVNVVAVSASPNPTNNPQLILTLRDNQSMPIIGLGVALAFEKTYPTVLAGLQSGYRLIDTAADETYANQDLVGLAIRDWLRTTSTESSKNNETESNSRSDLFVTTKLWDDSHGFYPAIFALYESLGEFQYLDYIDLYLMHSPFGGYLVETWDAMIYLQQQGMIKSIGVSNFGRVHLQALKDSGRPLPVVNQIEMHPLLYQRRLPLIQWCQDHNITIQAYGSIMAGDEESLQDPFLTTFAQRYNKSSAQVLLRWAVQHGFAIIPKSTRPTRIRDNMDLFDFVLEEQDMIKLDHWGDGKAHEDVLYYKEDWNWNPVDEAEVHLGRVNSFWAKDFKDLDTDYIEDYLENEIYANDDSEDEWDDNEPSEDDSASSEDSTEEEL